MRYTPDGVAAANVRLAVDRDYKNKNGEYETDFFSCVAWRKTAELMTNNLKKGRLISAQGRLQARQYEKDGIKRTVYEIMIETFHFLDQPKNGEAPAARADDVPLPDDLPF